MTSLGITIPSSGRGSPASDDSSQIQTPVSPSFAEAPTSTESNSATGNKRKSARRPNTAERRATHNAVERARRETLNGRFLDLAALLPNLSQIRRPSKSAIVNSSIAHVHASRRHRLLASRELRLLKLEADALRKELDGWRDRAGIPRVQEPVRGDGFSMILSGEIEILPDPSMEEEDAEYAYGDEEGNGFVGGTPASEQEAFEFSMKRQNQNQNQNIPHRPPPSNGFEISMEQQQQMMRRGAGPMVASPGGMAVENPVMGMMYNNNMGNMPYPGPSPFMTPDMDQTKWAPNPNISEQEIMSSLSRRSSMATPDIRRSRGRAMSTSSSGGGSPPHQMGYFDPGPGFAMGGMAPPNMGPNMGMIGGGGSVGNGASFPMM